MPTSKTALNWLGLGLVSAAVVFSSGACTKQTAQLVEISQGNKPAAGKTVHLMVGGSGTNLALTRKLADAYMAKNPKVSITIPESLGSAGGIKNTKDGVVDLGLVSRRLNSTEKNLGLTYIPYARVLIGFAVHPSQPIENLTGEQLTDIYDGKLTNWEQVGGTAQPIVVLTREQDDSSMIVWKNLIPGFQRNGQSPRSVLLRTDQAMNEAIASVENGIGWTDLGSVMVDHLRVKLLKINGVRPSYANLVSGKYPYVKELAFVVKGQPSETVQGFIDFTFSPEGLDIIRNSGYSAVPGKTD